MTRLSKAAIAEQHHGTSDHYDGHRPSRVFDYYCVAHDEDYSPKYLDGEVCHDSMGEGWCNDSCRICPQPCPIVPCPVETDDD